MDSLQDEFMEIINYGHDCKMYHMYQKEISKLSKGMWIKYNHKNLENNPFCGFIHNQDPKISDEFDFVDSKLFKIRIREFNSYFSNSIEFIDRTTSGSYMMQDCHINYFIQKLYKNYNESSGANALPLVPIDQDDIFYFIIKQDEKEIYSGEKKAIEVYNFLKNIKGNSLFLQLKEKSPDHEDYVYALKRLNLKGHEYSINCDIMFNQYYNSIEKEMEKPLNRILIRDLNTLHSLKELYHLSKAIESKLLIIMYLSACVSHVQSSDNIFASQTKIFMSRYAGYSKVIEEKMIQGITKIIFFIEK